MAAFDQPLQQPRPIITEREGGDVLVSLAYVERILPRECPLNDWVWAADHKVGGSGMDDQEIRLRGHDGYLYSPLKLLNSLLKSIPQNPLQLELVPDEGGAGGLGETLIVRPLRRGRTHSRLARLEHSDQRVSWLDVPPDYSIRANSSRGQAAVTQEQDVAQEEPRLHQDLSQDRRPPSTPPPQRPASAPPQQQQQQQQQQAHEASQNPCPTPSSARLNKARRGLLTQLRELDLASQPTLRQLLDNAFVPALSKFHVRPPQGLVHLATLAGTGQVYSVRILTHAYARREDLSFASLCDATMAAVTNNDYDDDDDNNNNNTTQHRLTPYQIFEMAQILKTVSRTPYGGLFWASFAAMWPAEWPAFQRRTKAPVDLAAIARRLHHHVDFYTTLGALQRDVDRLAHNAERFWGPWDERTAAAQRTVGEIYRLMGQSCAVGSRDTQDKAFYHGLVRELILPASLWPGTNHPSAPPPGGGGGGGEQHALPRYVLPLGSLHVAEDYTQEPQATAGFVLMDITRPQKALWLVEYEQDCCRLVMLAPDVECWRLADEGRFAHGLEIASSSAAAAGATVNVGGLLGRKQQPGTAPAPAPASAPAPAVVDRAVIPTRDTLTDEYPETQITAPAGAILFRRPERERALRAISAGWAGTVRGR